MAYGAGYVSIADTWPKATFGTIAFPVESSRIVGGIRRHTHEYPHSPGGAGEKLGRKIYVFEVVATFDTNFDAYPGLYPQDLDTLMGNFEQQATQDLRLPQMAAAVPCFAVGWTREMSAKVRSGERVTITFEEDQTSVFLFGDIVALGTGQIELAATALQATADEILSQLFVYTTTPGLLDSLQDAVNFVLSFRDQALLYDARFSAAVQQVQDICGQLDASPDMQVVAAYPLVELLHQIWQAAQKMQQDLAAQGAVLQTWICPMTQGINTVAIQLYGDTTRVGDLLALNPFPDSQRIKAGTPVLYYPA